LITFADAGDKYVIAQANAPLTEIKEFTRDRASAVTTRALFSQPESVDFMMLHPISSGYQRVDPIP
jgi:hypothetical protein